MLSVFPELFLFWRPRWRPVRYRRNACVHRAMDGRHLLVGTKTVVGEESPEGERRIRIHSAPLRFRRRRGVAWEEAKHWKVEREAVPHPQFTRPARP